MTIVDILLVVILIILVIYLGIGTVVGRLYYQDYKPKKIIISKKEKTELILNAIGIALAWGPLLLWVIIDDVKKGNRIWI